MSTTTIETPPLTEGAQVTDLDQLGPLPLGTVLKVTSTVIGDQFWTKTDAGFASMNHVIQADALIGSVNDRRLFVHTLPGSMPVVAEAGSTVFPPGPPEPGQAWASDDFRYIILAVNGNGMVTAARFNQEGL